MKIKMKVSLATQTALEFKPKTQTEKILDYLLNPVGTRISTWIAYEEFRCTCLAQRIYDIKKKLDEAYYRSGGFYYKIKDETVIKNGKHFTEYWIERKNLNV